MWLSALFLRPKVLQQLGGIWERSNDGILPFVKVKERRKSQQWASNHKNVAWDSLESYLHYWRKIHKCLRLMYQKEGQSVSNCKSVEFGNQQT